MNLKSGPIIRGALGILLGGLILYFIFNRVSPQVLLVELARVDKVKVIWAVIFIGLQYVFRAALWQALLHPFRNYHYGAVFRATMIGYLSNNFLPARLGDMMRGACLYLAHGGNSGFILGSLALERVMDISLVLVVLGTLLVRLDLHYDWLVRSIIILGSLVIVFFIAAIVLRHWARRGWLFLHPFLLRMQERVLRFVLLKNPQTFMADLGNSMRLANTRRGILWLVLTWFITFWGLYFSLDALGLTSQIGGPQVALILSISALGLAVPSLPASLGTYQAAFIFGAVLVGISESQALSASFLYQGLWVSVTSILGLLSMAWEGISFKKLLAGMMGA